MALPVRVPDHQARALEDLVSQYSAATNLRGLVACATAEHQVLEDQLWRMYCETIDSATGAQLDVYGALVGQPREGRPDDLYRLWIKARVLINKSHGTGPEIIAIFTALVSGTASVMLEEQFPAALVLRLGFSAIVDPAQGGAILQKARPVGVRAIFEGATSEDSSSFAFDPNGAGFGTATLATETTVALVAGATSLPVLSSTGFAVNDTIIIEPGESQEARSVTAIPDGTHLTVAALSRNHRTAVEVRRTLDTGGTFATAF